MIARKEEKEQSLEMTTLSRANWSLKQARTSMSEAYPSASQGKDATHLEGQKKEGVEKKEGGPPASPAANESQPPTALVQPHMPPRRAVH